MQKLIKFSPTNLGDTTLKVSFARKRFLDRFRLLLQRAYQSLGVVEVPLILFAFRLLKIFRFILMILYRHLHPNSLSWCKFHGPSKPSIEELGNFDVVITTYKTVALQWKVHKKQPMGLKTLFSLYWHRIVLDEGMLSQYL
jgi:hypothetical protein